MILKNAENLLFDRLLIALKDSPHQSAAYAVLNETNVNKTDPTDTIIELLKSTGQCYFIWDALRDSAKLRGMSLTKIKLLLSSLQTYKPHEFDHLLDNKTFL